MSGKIRQKGSLYKRSNPLIIKKHKRKDKKRKLDWQQKEREFTRYDLSVSNVSINSYWK